MANFCEEGFRFAGEFDHAPADAKEAIQNYETVLDSLGQLCAEFIAPRAEGVDREGNVLKENGTVTRAKGIAEAIEKLGQAEVMGFTLPHRFGGLNFPNIIYSIAIEILSRADAALMNIFGLQGIAETINAFACEEIKQKYLHDFSAGKVTGAMVLTEPDAGSALQQVKLRIHGSATCEIFFDNTPCEIIGERQRGLITYVMSLMNGARIGIAAQAIGIAEAAYRVDRDYAASRRQFGVAIEKLPAVRDMIIDMKLSIEAGRALLYEASRVVDMEFSYA